MARFSEGTELLFTVGTELLPTRRKRPIVPNRVIRSIAESCRGLFFRRDIECRQIIMTTSSRITKRVSTGKDVSLYAICTLSKQYYITKNIIIVAKLKSLLSHIIKKS